MATEGDNSNANARSVNDALLGEAIARLKTRGDAVSRLGCMALPAAVFNDLCRMIVESSTSGGRGIQGVAEWLSGQVADAPTRSSVYRFAEYLLEEYRLAQLASTRAQAAAYVSSVAGGDADALQVALNQRTTELLTELMLRTGSLDEFDDKRLLTVLAGVRSVAQTAFDKRKMDARLKALQAAVEKAQRDIALKDAKLAEIQTALQRLQSQAAAKKTITADDIAAASKMIFG